MTKAQVARTLRRVQEIENSAADKSAVGFLALDEAQLTGKGAATYAGAWTERLVRAIGADAIEAAKLGRAFLAQVAQVKPAAASTIGSDHLAIFRAKVMLLLIQYGERLRLFIAENKVKGATVAGLKDQKDREFSRWTFNRDALRKSIMKEAGGLINSLFHAGYLDGIKPGTK